MKKLLHLELTLIAVGIGFNGFSQTKKKNIQLDSAVVSTKHIEIPYSAKNRDVVVLNKKEIQSLPVKSVDELLSYVAGIDVRRRGIYGSQADIGINGGTFDETLVLLNGIKIIDPQTGHNMMNLPISIDDIQKIEILKGPAASAYGVNAINGAINIITRQPKGTEVSADLSAGSSLKNDTSNNKLYGAVGFQATASLGSKKMDNFLAFGTTQSNGYRYNTPVDNKKIFYSNKIKLGNSHINMMGGFVKNDYGANGFYSPPADINSREIVQTTIAAIDGDIQVNDFWLMHPSLSYRYNFDDYIFVRDHPEIYENRHFTNVEDARLDNSFFTRIGTFGLGLEYRNVDINSNNLGVHNRNNMGLFGKYSINITPKMSANLGLYANYSNDFGWDYMPSADLGYQINKNLHLFASAGKGMRLPTYTDWYYKGPENIGNPDLKPEISWQTTVGIKYNTKKMNATASYFYHNTSDFIDWVKDSVNDPWHTENFQDIKTQGIDVAVDYKIIESPDKKYGLLTGVSYTWLNPELTKGIEASGTGKISHYALDNLRNQLDVHAGLTLFKNFNLTITGKYQQRVNYKDYFLLAARVSATIKDFKIYFDASNLTDVEYLEEAACPLPGTWFTLGVKWDWMKK